MEPRCNLTSQASRPNEEASSLQTTKQLATNAQVRQPPAAAWPGVLPAERDVEVLNLAEGAQQVSLLQLPSEILVKICLLVPNAAPALRLTCKPLRAATPAKKLRLIPSPDQTDAAYQKAMPCPARLAPLIELDLTEAGDLVHSSLVSAAGQHSHGLESIALANLDDLEHLTHLPKLSKLVVHNAFGKLRVGTSNFSHLTKLNALRALSISGYLCPAEDDSTKAFRLLRPILGLHELTCLELELKLAWELVSMRFDYARPTNASFRLICTHLPKLTRLVLKDCMGFWDEASLARLATLTGLTALSIGHDPEYEATYRTLFEHLAALPHLADLTLYLKSSSSLHALPALLQRADGALSPLRSLTLDFEDGRTPFSAISQHLGAAPFLTHLSVFGNVPACSDDLVCLAAFLPELRSLRLYYVLLAEAGAQLANLSQLTALTLVYTNFQNTSSVTSLSCLGSLQSLSTDILQQQGLAAIGQLTRLTSLVLHGSIRDGAEGLQHLSQLKQLEYLEFASEGLSVEDPGFYAALVHLTALKQCRRRSWGLQKACSFDDIRRRHLAQKPVG